MLHTGNSHYTQRAKLVHYNGIEPLDIATSDSKYCMEYIVHGSKNQNDSNFKLTSERSFETCATFRSASTSAETIH